MGALGVFANGVFFATDLIPGVGAAEKALAKGAAKAVAKDVAENETKQVAEQGTKTEAASGAKPEPSARENAPEAPSNDPPSGGCFIAGTLVSTPQGDVPIEKIKAGDLVWSLDLKTGHVVERKVESIFSHVTEYWVDVTAGGETITATRGHRFWVESLKRWVPADELKPGMKLLGSSGHLIAVTHVHVRHLSADATTYNFFVADTHVYFVGPHRLLVHNGDDDQKTYQTYTKTRDSDKKVYSGRTSGTGSAEENVQNRDKNHHKNDEGYGPAELDKSSVDKDAIRGREQQNIEKNGGAASQGGTSGNDINGVSDTNPNKDKYNKAANKKFGKC